jgi:hypothetical protein
VQLVIGLALEPHNACADDELEGLHRSSASHRIA